MGNPLNIVFEPISSQDDILTQVLRLLQVEGALTSCIRLRSPWGIRADLPSGKFSFHVVSQGECYLVSGDDPPTRLRKGDLVFFPHGCAHTLVDHPDTVPGSIEDLLNSAPGHDSRVPASTATSDQSIVICGAYSYRSDLPFPFIKGLPEILILPSDIQDHAVRSLIALLTHEALNPLLGSMLATNRLLDALLIYALRLWVHQSVAVEETWLSALYNANIGPVIQAIHQAPERLWTIDEMARLAGNSPATLTRKFKSLVGEAPLAYITRWRMMLAAELLRGGHSIDAVAERVGYEDRFAFTKAFKRVRGVTPGLLVPSRSIHEESSRASL